MDDVSNVVRIKHPKLGEKCDYGAGRSAAIRIFCLSCMGGESDASSLVKGCASTGCPLWRYRLGTGSERTPSASVPKLDEYKELIKKAENPARVAWGKQLGSKKHKK